MKSKINFFLIIAMILMFVQILLGISVREFIDNQIDVLGLEKKNFWLNEPELNFYIHRTFSLLVFLSNLYLLVLAKMSKIDMKFINLINLLIFIEIAVGASMYYFSFPILTQPIHLLISISILSLQFYWFLNLKKPY
ncbi:MAG: COX15/CtaA family protein [Flavobacteriaceae bacterium]|tara:strand:- start:625 stop:1035 length:411 start_codon:yes stop_codon:yes gene_type:complete